MTLALIAAVSFLLDVAATPEGHPSGYAWTVTSSAGDYYQTDHQCFQVEVPDDRLWRFHLDVLFLHESPFGPYPWVVATEEYFAPDLLFADGFELGNTTRWNQEGAQ